MRPAGAPALHPPSKLLLSVWPAPRVVLAASVALVALTVLADYLIDPTVVVLTVFLGLGPLLASSTLAAGSTAVFAVAVTCLAAVSGLWNHDGAQYWVRLADVALIGALSVVVAAFRAHREEDLRTTRHIAGVAQQALLPVLPAEIGSVRLATRYHSASHTAQVGGDFFDFVAEGERVRIMLGDVSGKGVDAVTQAARVIRAFRQYGGSEANLLSVARRVDEYVTPFWQWELFATAVFIEIDRPGVLTVVCAGHPAPLLASNRGVDELDVRTCLPLGLGPAEHVTVHAWQPSDRLLLYTDGLVEARDRAGRFLPRRTIDGALGAPDASACLDLLLHEVISHAGHLNDDLALLLMTHAEPVRPLSKNIADSLSRHAP